MARGKVQMKQIENPLHRQVTFCKRRGGLLKKAKELSALCDADIGLIIFSNKQGKLYEFATNGTMGGMIERYMEKCSGTETEKEENQSLELKHEILMLKQEIQMLQMGFRCMFEEGAEIKTLDELHGIERYIEYRMRHIRSAKMQIMFQEIQLLRNKGEILEAANEVLQEKVVEQNEIIGVPPMIAGCQNGIFDGPPMIAGFPSLLTLQNQI